MHDSAPAPNRFEGLPIVGNATAEPHPARTHLAHPDLVESRRAADLNEPRPEHFYNGGDTDYSTLAA